MNEETKEAIKRLRRIIKVSKETAYDLVYSEIDIKCTEIVLDYIEELEKENLIQKTIIYEDIKQEGSTQLVSKERRKI